MSLSPAILVTVGAAVARDRLGRGRESVAKLQYGQVSSGPPSRPWEASHFRKFSAHAR